MNDKPLVSIIVPVYNVEKYLEKCLESLVNQTYKKIEIICINDGSKDNSLKILKAYAQNDERIKIIDQENMGLSGARNAGIQVAAGKYIMFVDSDDWVDNNTCWEAVKIAEESKSEVVLWSYVREFKNDSKEKYMFWKDKEIFNEEEVKDKLHRKFVGLLDEELARPDYANAIETAWGKLYLATLIQDNKISFIDTKIIGTEDALFNLYVFGYVKKAVYLRRCFNHYRRDNETSLTSSYKSELYKQWNTLFDYMETYIKEEKLGKDYEKALNNRIALSILGLGLNIMRSNDSPLKKIKNIHKIIASKRFQKAYKKMDYQYFPLHWRVFYTFAKYRCASGVYLLLFMINKLR